MSAASDYPDLEEALRGGFDPDKLRGYFSTRPLELSRRLVEVSKVAWRIYWTWKSEDDVEVSRRRRGNVLARGLENLGPAFVKVGQTLAQRPDLVGEEAAEALKVLQISALPFPDQEAFAIIREDLAHRGPLAPSGNASGGNRKGNGTRLPLLRSISNGPVAAASLGQVYRATTHDGLEVAIKVQRPGVARQLALDWLTITFLIGVYRKFIPGPNDFTLLVDEAARNMLMELDYHNEARNMDEFARRHASVPFVRVPRWLPELTGPPGTARVLTTEWIDGRRISQLPLNLGRRAVRMAVQACVMQLLLTGFVHADPHEGNLLYTADDRLAFLDFGLMDRVEPKVMEGFADGIQGVVAGDWLRVTKAMQAVGFVPTPPLRIESRKGKPGAPPPPKPPPPGVPRAPPKPGGGDERGVYFECGIDELAAAVGAQMRAEKGGDSRFSAMAAGLEKLSWRYVMLTPSYIVLATRTFMTLEGLAEKVDPGFNIYAAALPAALRRALAPRTPQARRALRDAVLTETGRVRWAQLEDLLVGPRSEADDVGSLRAAWRAMSCGANASAASAELGTPAAADEGDDSALAGSLLGSPDGAALRRIARDIDLSALVRDLASVSGRPWRRRAAAWLSQRLRARRPPRPPPPPRRPRRRWPWSAKTAAFPGNQSVAESIAAMVRRQALRQKQVVRLLVATHARRLLATAGVFGTLLLLWRVVAIAGGVFCRGVVLAILEAVGGARRRARWRQRQRQERRRLRAATAPAAHLPEAIGRPATACAS